MKTLTSIRQQIQVRLGIASTAIGTLIYVKQGRCENTAFAYLNPFPDKVRESKTGLSGKDRLITELGMLLVRAPIPRHSGLAITFAPGPI